jgi:hypothetical protein
MNGEALTDSTEDNQADNFKEEQRRSGSVNE